MKILNPLNAMGYGMGLSDDPFWAGVCFDVRNEIDAPVITTVFKSIERCISSTVPRMEIARLEDWSAL